MEPAPAVRPSAAPEADKQAELRDRLAVSILLLPFVFLLVQVGGWLYLIGVLTILLFAAIEFGGLFVTMHQRPAVPLLMAGVALLVAAEQYPVLNLAGGLPALLVLAALTWHLVDYERGAPQAGTDFVVTLAGIFYLGLLGRCFVRFEGGAGWAVVAADGFGQRFVGGYRRLQLWAPAWPPHHSAAVCAALEPQKDLGRLRRECIDRRAGRRAAGLVLADRRWPD